MYHFYFCVLGLGDAYAINNIQFDPYSHLMAWQSQLCIADVEMSWEMQLGNFVIMHAPYLNTHIYSTGNYAHNLQSIFHQV